MLHALEQRAGIVASARVSSLRKLLASRQCIRVMEAHNPISALLVENTRVKLSDAIIEYDAVWSSSLTDSTSRGKPDIEMLDVQSRLHNVGEIFEVTRKPMIFDGDTGGKLEHFVHNVRSLERVGVSAVIIEDKAGLKKNSLLGTDVYQTQEHPDVFCEKINAGKEAQLTDAFMIVARVESLVLDAGMTDALYRASRYVVAGADGIMIHSRKSNPAEIMRFASQFRLKHPTIPLVCVPSSFNEIYFYELASAGFNIVIYANHMLRSAYLSMKHVAAQILADGRSVGVEAHCLSIPEILTLIPGTR